MKLSIKLFFCLFGCLCLQAESDPVEQIMQARQRQQTASYKEYYELEQKIAEIKNSSENHQKIQPSSWYTQFITDVYHWMPAIFWQVLFLIIHLFIVIQFARRRPISLSIFILFVVVSLLVSVGYYEQTKGPGSPSWLVIPHQDVPVYVGPNEKYPLVAHLHYLDEIVLLKKVDVSAGEAFWEIEWYGTDQPQLRGWVRAW